MSLVAGAAAPLSAAVAESPGESKPVDAGPAEDTTGGFRWHVAELSMDQMRMALSVIDCLTISPML